METKVYERIKYEKEDILKLLRNKEYVKLREYLNETNEVDIAEVIGELENPLYCLLVFRMLPKKSASAVFAYLDLDSQINIMDSISEKEIKEILDELFFDDIIDMIEEMPAEFVTLILKHISREERSLVNQFLKYPEDSVGSLMTIEYAAFNKNYTVGRALEYLHNIGAKKENIYSSYIVGNNNKLIGIVSLRKLVTSDLDAKMEDIMEEDVIYLSTDDDQEFASDIFKKYGFISMPVVDDTNKLVGIVTVDDILHVMEEEDTEDFQKMAAIIPTDDEYLDTNPLKLAKNRIPSLLILLFSATISGFIINSNLNILGKFGVLSTLMPMLTDTGGNAASQSSTLVIRGLSTGDVKEKDVPKILLKELKVSVIIAFVLVFVILFRVLILENEGIKIALTIIFTLMVTVFSSNIVGGILPILAEKVGLDPATVAVPVITTVVDALSLLIYFEIAKSILL